MSHQGTVWSQAQKCIHWPPWREFQEENAGGRWGRTAGPSAGSKEQSESQIGRTRDGSWENRGRWTFWAKGTAGVKASERRRAQELRVAWPGAGQVDFVQSSGHWPGNPGTSLQDFHQGMAGSDLHMVDDHVGSVWRAAFGDTASQSGPSWWADSQAGWLLCTDYEEAGDWDRSMCIIGEKSGECSKGHLDWGKHLLK